MCLNTWGGETAPVGRKHSVSKEWDVQLGHSRLGLCTTAGRRQAPGTQSPSVLSVDIVMESFRSKCIVLGIQHVETLGF